MHENKDVAFEAFRAAVHVKYVLGGQHPDGIPHDGTAERVCAKAYRSDDLLTTDTDEFLARLLEEDREWRRTHPPRRSAIYSV